jgi:hypothetical protein
MICKFDELFDQALSNATRSTKNGYVHARCSVFLFHNAFLRTALDTMYPKKTDIVNSLADASAFSVTSSL